MYLVYLVLYIVTFGSQQKPHIHKRDTHIHSHYRRMTDAWQIFFTLCSRLVLFWGAQGCSIGLLSSRGKISTVCTEGCFSSLSKQPQLHVCAQYVCLLYKANDVAGNGRRRRALRKEKWKERGCRNKEEEGVGRRSVWETNKESSKRGNERTEEERKQKPEIWKWHWQPVGIQ